MGRWNRDELADIDTVAVQRAMDGDPADASKGERFLAAIELRRQGLSYDAIADRLRVNIRQVYRYLAVAGMTSTGHVSAKEWAPRTAALVTNYIPGTEASG